MRSVECARDFTICRRACLLHGYSRTAWERRWPHRLPPEYAYEDTCAPGQCRSTSGGPALRLGRPPMSTQTKGSARVLPSRVRSLSLRERVGVRDHRSGCHPTAPHPSPLPEGEGIPHSALRSRSAISHQPLAINHSTLVRAFCGRRGCCPRRRLCRAGTWESLDPTAGLCRFPSGRSSARWRGSTAEG